MDEFQQIGDHSISLVMMESGAITRMVNGVVLLKAVGEAWSFAYKEQLARWMTVEQNRESFVWYRKGTDESMTWVPSFEHPLSALEREYMLSREGKSVAGVVMQRILCELDVTRLDMLGEVTENRMMIQGPFLGSIEFIS